MTNTNLCNCCGRTTNKIVPIGVQYGLDDAPALILWNCECGTTRAIRWHEASDAERHQAHLAEMSREASEMMMGRG